MSSSDLRFRIPLYTIKQVAGLVDVPSSTLARWVQGAKSDDQVGATAPIVTRLPPERPRYPCIPFVGLVEAVVIAAVRKSGVPMQRIRPALGALEQKIGLAHALASRRLYTDGAELLYDYADSQRDPRESQVVKRLVSIRSGQGVFTEAVMDFLRRIEYAVRVGVPAFAKAEVIADPERSFGSPIFVRGGCRVDDVLDRFWAGESLTDLVGEFGVPLEQLEDVVRVTSRRAA